MTSRDNNLWPLYILAHTSKKKLLSSSTTKAKNENSSKHDLKEEVNTILYCPRLKHNVSY